jgi:hypothetical protein
MEKEEDAENFIHPSSILNIEFLNPENFKLKNPRKI